MSSSPFSAPSSGAVLAGVRIVSLALNLPGPAALMRLAAMGAECIKVEPPMHGGTGGDPMAAYSPQAYDALHVGIARERLDLKTVDGRRALHRLLADADVLITSFRPSALQRLAVDPATLHADFPSLAVVMIVGEHGAEAEHPGHDLTYEAQAGLLSDLRLPVAPFADMAGALLVTEAVLRALLARLREPEALITEEVALIDAAAFLALPREWGLTAPTSPIGGAHAGYRVYACSDGRVAVAALEPRLAAALCRAAGLSESHAARLHSPAAQGFFEAFFAERTCEAIAHLAQAHGLPLVVLPETAPRA